MIALRKPPRPLAVILTASLVVLIILLLTRGTSSAFRQNLFSAPPPYPANHKISESSSSSSRPQSEHLYSENYHGQSTPSEINRVTNRTLGFSKILVVALPERSDKRDAMVLTSALTGFNLEFVDGVKGEHIPDKAIPYGVTREGLWDSNLGSWRGHMNAIRKIVEDNLDSALIMEDDMDWDVRLRSQLEGVAKGARHVLSPGVRDPISPYGDDWDLLWLGHCAEAFPETFDENKSKPANDPGLLRMQKKYVIKNDPTVPPLDKITGQVDFKSYPEFTRWVHISGAPICTFAYALSQRGARKVLFDLSVDHLTAPFDLALSSLCHRAVSSWGEDEAEGGEKGLNMNCISVTPSVFFHHRPKGRVGGDSDIQNNGGDQIREKGTTENMVWSARNNLKNLILGRPMENQFAP